MKNGKNIYATAAAGRIQWYCSALYLVTILLAVKTLSASIVQINVDSYVVNCDATQCGLLAYYPPVEVLDVQPGVWRMTPVNPDIEQYATYMAWNYFSSGPTWVWGVGLYDLPTQQDLGGISHGGFYPAPEDAFYADPPFQPLDFVFAVPTTICFVTGDSYIEDNLGGASVRFERVPEPTTLLLLGLGGLALMNKKKQ